MTVGTAALRPAAVVAGGFAIAAAGCLFLLARPWLVAGHSDPTPLLVLLFVALGVAGWRWPLPARAASPVPAATTVATVAAVLALGLAAFAAGRLIAGDLSPFGLRSPVPLLARSAVLSGLAAVAEEAFFRRLVYGLAEPWGVGVAVVASAAAFAAVHVDPATLGPLPLGFRAVGNSYRVTITYLPSGAEVAGLAKPGTVALTAAAPGDVLLHSAGGRGWTRLEARPYGQSHGLFADLTATGWYLVASSAAAPGGGGSGATVLIVGLAAVPLVAAYFLPRGRNKGPRPRSP